METTRMKHQSSLRGEQSTKQSMYFWMLCFFFLSACSTDTTPDEEFEAPTTNFPLLGTVPDRPALPQCRVIQNKKKQLEKERDKANEQAKTVKAEK